MNDFLIWSFKAAAVAMRIKADGLTDELAARLHDLQDAFPTTVAEWAGPKADGTPWTVSDLDALADVHYAITSGLRARHGGGLH